MLVAEESNVSANVKRGRIVVKATSSRFFLNCFL
jgi:hypothetical protein